MIDNLAIELPRRKSGLMVLSVVNRLFLRFFARKNNHGQKIDVLKQAQDETGSFCHPSRLTSFAPQDEVGLTILEIGDGVPPKPTYPSPESAVMGCSPNQCPIAAGSLVFVSLSDFNSSSGFLLVFPDDGRPGGGGGAAHCSAVVAAKGAGMGGYCAPSALSVALPGRFSFRHYRGVAIEFADRAPGVLASLNYVPEDIILAWLFSVRLRKFHIGRSGVRAMFGRHEYRSGKAGAR